VEKYQSKCQATQAPPSSLLYHMSEGNDYKIKPGKLQR